MLFIIGFVSMQWKSNVSNVVWFCKLPVANVSKKIWMKNIKSALIEMAFEETQWSRKEKVNTGF